MICTACQHDNPSDSTFCGGCGARIAIVCPHCRESSPPRNTFCGNCGQRLTLDSAETPAGAREENGERRQLTVLFCDLVGSTDLSARLDPEEYRDALRAYHSNAGKVITHYGGYVAQHLGDGLLVYFGWPQTYDDAAERAVRAGLGLVEATATVQAGGAPLAARVGLHTGTAVVSEIGTRQRHETLAVGDTLNLAARVQGAAELGQVFITAATHRLVSGRFIVEERGVRALKGIPQPVELYRVVQPSGMRGRLQAAAARGFTPFVNRTEERALLRSRFERVCDGEGHVVMLMGEAGIGKSRLAQVLREDLAGTPHTWLETGCAPHFANTAFHAVAELLKQRSPWEDNTPEARVVELEEALHVAGLVPAEAVPLVAPLLDVTVPDSYRPVLVAPEVARKRLLATLAAWLFGMSRLQPLVILIEDLHWVDPSTLELLQLVVAQAATAPLLVLGSARPQFQVPWPPRAHYTQLTLSRLAKRHVRDMVLGVAAQATLLAEVVDQVAARTDGVPLFVEELTKAVIEVGAIAATRDIPSTLADLLMARLDRLGPQAKEVAQVAAVCGRDFSFALIEAVHSLSAGELEKALAKLVDAELLHVRGLVPEATYSFKHALVQDAAYESLLKSRRRVLHAQVARALRERFPKLAEERPELLAYHHEFAGQLEPAIAAWQLAGDRSVARGANREAERHLERGLELVALLPEGPQRDWTQFQFLVSLGQVRLYTQGFGAPAAAEALRHAMQLGEQLADPVQLSTLVFGLFASELARNGPAAARPLSEQLLSIGQRSGKSGLEAIGHHAVGLTDYHLGDCDAARVHYVTAIELYGDSTSVLSPVEPGMAVRTHLADACWHLGFADQAQAVLQEAEERIGASARAADRAWLGHQGFFISLFRRDTEEAMRYVRMLTDACSEEPSAAYLGGVAKIAQGWCVAQGGQADAGVALVQVGIEEMAATGQRLGLELMHCILADTCLLAGDLDAALRALAAGEDTCPDNISDRALTLGRRAELLVRRAAPGAEIEAAFATALDYTHRTGAISGALHIATAFARWLCDCGRAVEARDLLAPLYAQFTEGFGTRDLREAGELLDALRGNAGRDSLQGREGVELRR